MTMTIVFTVLFSSLIAEVVFAAPLTINLDSTKVYTFKNPMLIKDRQELDSKIYENSIFFTNMRTLVDRDPSWGIDSKSLSDCVQGNLRSDVGRANAKVWSVEAYTVMCASQKQNSKQNSSARFEGNYMLIGGENSTLRIYESQHRELLTNALKNEDIDARLIVSGAKNAKSIVGVDCTTPQNLNHPSCQEFVCDSKNGFAKANWIECEKSLCKGSNQVPVTSLIVGKMSQNELSKVSRQELMTAVGSFVSEAAFEKLEMKRTGISEKRKVPRSLIRTFASLALPGSAEEIFALIKKAAKFYVVRSGTQKAEAARLLTVGKIWLESQILKKVAPVVATDCARVLNQRFSFALIAFNDLQELKRAGGQGCSLYA